MTRTILALLLALTVTAADAHGKRKHTDDRQPPVVTCHQTNCEH